MRKLLLTVLLLFALGGASGTTAEAHIFKHKSAWQNYKHAKYVCAKGSGGVKRWHCATLKWKVFDAYERVVTDWRSYLLNLVGHSIYHGCALPLIGRESGGVVTKWNYQGSGAYGLGQALPPSKMAPYGRDYMTNGVTQIRWMNDYVRKYGGWCGANAFQAANNSY